MVTYLAGTKRRICRFVFRLRIDDDVRYLKKCSWEEEFQISTSSEGPLKEWSPTRFISTGDFIQMSIQY